MTDYRVIAPVVVAKVDGEHGKAWRHKQQGWTFSDADVDPQWLECHLRDNMVAPISGAATPAAAPLAEPQEELAPASEAAAGSEPKAAEGGNPRPVPRGRVAKP